jgi:hypothetical protein
MTAERSEKGRRAALERRAKVRKLKSGNMMSDETDEMSSRTSSVPDTVADLCRDDSGRFVSIATQPKRVAQGRRLPIDQRVRRFKRKLLQVAPHLCEPRYGPMIHTFASVSILQRDACEYLRLKGLVNDQGELRGSVGTVNTLCNTMLKLANALGLTPLSLSRFKPSELDDLAAQLAK